ncbi:hypothetical protein E2C01_003930 [Portunus trituberculatus]|uniref:Uncharacterized protein n=1 Tax=Portunus trituberculatus TaxID=210409 RepID=A0A5B7CP98_PORTR|nr:hypothetical protein [Portunus trituberculatus]
MQSRQGILGHHRPPADAPKPRKAERNYRRSHRVVSAPGNSPRTFCARGIQPDQPRARVMLKRSREGKNGRGCRK